MTTRCFVHHEYGADQNRQMNLSLGAFELTQLLGRGGMGEVWRGLHRRQGVEVALKLITSDRTTEDRYHAAFRAEVQAMATLHHPGIAMVLDYGRVDPAAAEKSRGRFEVDAPYLAMELADGSLDQFTQKIGDWEDVLDILTQVLDALAHAHASGLIHRDIKPQNILVTGGDAPAYKLADFGLARTLADDDERRAAAGTPKYMAPEQILADVREQGPWTDLYALGCVAHWLVNGQPPYAFEESDHVFRGHLMEPLPPFRPTMRVPGQFEAWLHTMLAKEPRARFRCAADARWALEQVEDGVWVGVDLAEQPDEEVDLPPTVVDQPTSTASAGFRDATRPDPPGPVPRSAGTAAAVVELDPPPMPAHWRRPPHPLASMRLVGAGLGLYGLRPIPMVDRDNERSTIWSTLRSVRESNVVRTVILEGTAGTGKSRIAQWMTQRVHETGVGRVFQASHGPFEGAAQGLTQLVASAARVVGTDRTETVARMQEIMSVDGRGREFDAYDVFALADIAQGTGRWLENAAPEERFGVVARFLRAASGNRPAVVWLDDVQWGLETIQFMRYLHESDEPPAALFIATVRSEALVDRHAERVALLSFVDDDGVRRIEVGALSRHDQRELVARTLRLGDELARRVSDRTEGNPLFAVQLVGDWVDRGVLVVGEEGFEVSDPDAVVLPDTIHKLWSRRVDRGVHRYTGSATIAGRQIDPDEVIRSLEVAAALGQEISYDEWMRACAELEIAASMRLVEELVKLRLAERTPTGWQFVHGMMRESLERRAIQRGRFEDNHAACARVLRRMEGTKNQAKRVSEHLIAARRWAEALEPLLEAAEQTARRGEFDAALRLDDRRDAAMDELELPADDPRRIVGAMRRARTVMMLGRYDEAGEIIERAERFAGDDAADEVVAEVWWAKAGYARHLNDSEHGMEVVDRALEAYRRLGDDLGVARAFKRKGELARRLGRPAESIDCYRNAIQIIEGTDEAWELAWALLGLGTTERHIGRLEKAEEHVTSARDAFDDIGNRLGLGNAYNELGELSRALGRHEVAEQHYRRVLTLWGRREHTDLGVIRFNIGLTHVAREQYEQALGYLEDVTEAALERGYRVLVMYCDVARACCQAGLGDREGARRSFERFREAHDEIDFVDPDMAELAASLGQRVVDDPDLARAALRFALEQYETLGNEGRVKNVTDMMDRLTS